MKNQNFIDAPQIPLQERIKLFMERLHKGHPLWPYNDEVVIKECIKRGLIRRGRHRCHARWAKNILIPLVSPEKTEPDRVPRPYAKRIADLDSAGLQRRTSPSFPK